MDLFLIARIAGRSVAIPTAHVESVVDIDEIVPVPLAGGAVRGLMALRSRVVTVIDTGTALGLAPSAADRHRAVITVIDGHHYAILVEDLEDVAPFVAQPLTAGFVASGGWASCVEALIDLDGEPTLVIDLAALVPQPTLAAA